MILDGTKVSWYRSALVIAVLLSSCACRTSFSPVRPRNVPQTAIFALGNKGIGWWHDCTFNETDGHPHCTIWNRKGSVLYEGIFLPYDRMPLAANELKPTYNPRFADNSQFINLQNGRILIPGSDFERLARFLDWGNGKRRSP